MVEPPFTGQVPGRSASPATATVGAAGDGATQSAAGMPPAMVSMRAPLLETRPVATMTNSPRSGSSDQISTSPPGGSP